MKKQMRIGVLAGGPSSERAISLKSGEAVFQALIEEGLDAVFLNITGREDIKKMLAESSIDVAFIALHGRFGEDGTIQRVLEELRISYTGSGPEASRRALDKLISHEIFAKNNIPVPPYAALTKGSDDAKALAIGFPLVVKPQFEGSSIGLSIVEHKNDFKNAKELAFTYGDTIIVEKYIEGRELTVGILDDNALPVVEIRPKSKFYDYAAKYIQPDTEYLVPAPLSAEEAMMAQRYGVLAHHSLGCRQFSRVDIILGNDHTWYVLEVNTIPGLTARSLLPKAARQAGISFSKLCVNIIQSALPSGKRERAYV